MKLRVSGWLVLLGLIPCAIAQAAWVQDEENTFLPGDPGYTRAAEKMAHFEQDIIQTFLASRAWGKERVIEKKYGNSVSRSHVDISNWHDPAWDDAALAFMRHWGEHLVGLPNALSTEELFDEGYAIFEAGCREPMVVYANAWVMQQLDKHTFARDYFLRALSGMQNTEYPAIWKHTVQNRYAYTMHAAGFDKSAIPHFRGAFKHLRDAVQAGQYEGRERGLTLALFDKVRATIPIEIAQEFLEEVKQMEGVDPCTLQTVLGKYHIRRAWDCRGTGLARTVSEEGWASMRKHMKLASDHLVKAWELDPSRPEAATEMITVCMAGSPPRGTDLGVWLNRALAAEMDYEPAFNNVMFAISPRWGGSHEAVLELGVTCAASERYDTKLPLFFVYAVRQIRFDAMHPAPHILDAAEIYDLVVEVTDKLAAHPNHRHRRGWLRSVRVAVAFQSGRLDEVRAVAPTLGDDLDWQGLGYFGMKLADVDRITDSTHVTGVTEDAEN